MNSSKLQTSTITLEFAESNETTTDNSILPILDNKIAATTHVALINDELTTTKSVGTTTSYKTIDLTSSSTMKDSLTDSTPFTFHPLATTTQKTNQFDANVKVTTEKANYPSERSHEDKTESSLSTEGLKSSTPSLVTSFFSDNPKNILITSTIKPLTTSDLSIDQLVATSVKPVDENDVEIDDSSQSSTKKTSIDEHDESESNDNKVNELATGDSNILVQAVTEIISSSDDVTEASVNSQSEFPSSFSNDSVASLSTKASEIDASSASEKDKTDKHSSTIDEVSSSNITPTVAMPDDSQEDDISSILHEFFNDRNETRLVNVSRKHRMRNFFYYYFITAAKSNSTDVNRTIIIGEKDEIEDENEKNQEKFLGLPGDRS